MIQAVIFDFDGVVVLSEHLWDKADAQFMELHGVPDIDPYDYKKYIVGMSLTDGARFLRDHYGFNGEPAALAEQRRIIVKDLLSKEVDFIAGFKDFKKQLAAMPTAVATALDPDIMDVIDQKLGIRDLFNNHVYFIADVGYKPKPEPDVFLYAAQKIGIDPSGCVVLEDSANGLVAAKRAGMKALGITTTFPREELSQVADVVVDTYAEIDLQKLF